MRGEQQKSQMEMAFESEGEVKPEPEQEEGTEPLTAGGRPESQVGNDRLMEEILERGNLKDALKRVEGNKGAAGVDGMRVEDLRGYLKQEWPKLREELLRGEYEPQAVRRAEIPKAGGGKRKLGIPTAVDRLIQQAVLQVLQREWDPTFSEHGYGFRPGRTAHQAITQAQEYINTRTPGGVGGGRREASPYPDPGRACEALGRYTRRSQAAYAGDSSWFARNWTNDNATLFFECDAVARYAGLRPTEVAC